MNNGFKTVLARLRVGDYFKFKNGRRMYRCGSFVANSNRRCYYDAKTGFTYFNAAADVSEVIYQRI